MSHDIIDESIDRELSTEERLEYLLGRCHAIEQNIGRLVQALQKSAAPSSIGSFVEYLTNPEIREEFDNETENLYRRGYLASTIEAGKTLNRPPSGK